MFTRRINRFFSRILNRVTITVVLVGLQVASLVPGGPETFMIADEAAKNIFSSYLF